MTSSIGGRHCSVLVRNSCDSTVQAGCVKVWCRLDCGQVKRSYVLWIRSTGSALSGLDEKCAALHCMQHNLPIPSQKGTAASAQLHAVLGTSTCTCAGRTNGTGKPIMSAHTLSTACSYSELQGHRCPRSSRGHRC